MEGEDKFTTDLVALIRDGDFGKVVEHCELLDNFDKETRKTVINLADDSPPFKETPLHHACYCGNIQIVRYLLELQANPFSTCSEIGSTPLHRF